MFENRENLDTMYTDATSYESEMRYLTDAKLLWEGIDHCFAQIENIKRQSLHKLQILLLE